MFSKKKMQKVLIYNCALVPAFFSIAWIHTFGFTDYRHHLAYIGLPLGMAMGVLSIGMFLLKRWAVVISVTLTIFATIASIAIFFISKQLFHVAVVAVSCIYIYSSILYLRQTNNNA